MPTVTIPSARIPSTAQALSMLAAQLEPGILSYRVGGILDVIQPIAERQQRETEKLLEKHAAYDEKPGGGRTRRKIKDDAGERWEVRDEAAFTEENEKLYAGDEEVTLPWLLTEAHIHAIPRYLLAVPTPPPGIIPDPKTTPRRLAVNFAALRPVMARDEKRCDACAGSGILADDVHKTDAAS